MTHASLIPRPMHMSLGIRLDPFSKELMIYDTNRLVQVENVLISPYPFFLSLSPSLPLPPSFSLIPLSPFSPLLPLSLSLSLFPTIVTSIQAQNLKVCSIDDDLKQKLKKFRFRKATSNAAIISKQLLNNQLNYKSLRCSMPSEDQPLG